MPDDFSPELDDLAADYRILAELRRAPRSRTYAARHLRLNRDVVITVLGLPRRPDAAAAARLETVAADASALSALRHPGLVPVVEGRRLSDGSAAVIRARVRGHTLDTVIRSGAPFPLSRVAEVGGAVEDALRWARDHGIINRHLSGDDVLLQQGSGRLMVELEPWGDHVHRAPGGDETGDARNDARTVERVVYAMLTGRAVGDAADVPLAELRPDLPPSIIEELAALANADPAGPAVDPRILIELLAAAPGRFAGPAGGPDAAAPSPELSEPEVSDDVVTAPAGFAATLRSRRFLAQLGVLAVASAALGAAAVTTWFRGPAAARTSHENGVAPVPRASAAGGEVGEGEGSGSGVRGAADSMANGPVPDSTALLTQAAGWPASGTTAGGAWPGGSDSLGGAAGRDRGKRRPGSPGSSANAAPAAGPRPGFTSVVDVCELPDGEDQHACFATLIEPSERDVTELYQRLLDTLRRRTVTPARSGASAADTLARAQRAWLEARDALCGDVGDEPMFAELRAQCFIDEAVRRAQVLRTALDRPGAG